MAAGEDSGPEDGAGPSTSKHTKPKKIVDSDDEPDNQDDGEEGEPAQEGQPVPQDDEKESGANNKITDSDDDGIKEDGNEGYVFGVMRCNATKLCCNCRVLIFCY